MPDTLVPTDHPELAELVALVAAAEVAGDVLVSSNRLVDALLDARGGVPEDAVGVVDAALSACSHRTVVPTAEAVDLVTLITAASAHTPA
jgi:hypothetical protein